MESLEWLGRTEVTIVGFLPRNDGGVVIVALDE
jgi:hypothetical protein